MNNSFPVFDVADVIALQDRDYYHFLRNCVARSHRRLWASVFIIDCLDDPELLVRDLLRQLGYAAWRGLDVRVIVGTSDIRDIAVTNGASIYYLTNLRLRVREYRPAQYNQSLHSKYVVADDDVVLLGSHNWSSRAFSTNREDSVAIHSAPLNKLLAREFLRLWETATEVVEPT